MSEFRISAESRLKLKKQREARKQLEKLQAMSKNENPTINLAKKFQAKS